jgi:Spy/CpxP family protein refolding chaperone
MKPIKKQIAIFTLSALLISGTGLAFAFGGPKGHHGYDRGSLPMAALSQLEDLTDEQKDQLSEIRKTTRKSMRELSRAIRDNREDLRDAMDDNVDLETIRGLADKQGKQTARMIVLRAEIRDKINAVLNESQKKQLTDLRDQGRGFGRPRHTMNDRSAAGVSQYNQGYAGWAQQEQSSGLQSQGRGYGRASRGMNNRPACGDSRYNQRSAGVAQQELFYDLPY